MGTRLQTPSAQASFDSQEEDQTTTLRLHEAFAEQLWQHRETVSEETLDILSSMYEVTIGETPPQPTTIADCVNSSSGQNTLATCAAQDMQLAQPCTNLEYVDQFDGILDDSIFAIGAHHLSDPTNTLAFSTANASASQMIFPSASTSDPANSGMPELAAYETSPEDRFVRNHIEANSKQQ